MNIFSEDVGMMMNENRVLSKTKSQNHKTKMSSSSSTTTKMMLQGIDDVYDGVTVLEKHVTTSDPIEFAEQLAHSLQQWSQDGRRGIWLRLPRSKSQLIPIAVQRDFYFHHTTKNSITLCKWLPANEENKLPLYAHTQVGVGAFVVNSNNEILMIKEKTG